VAITQFSNHYPKISKTAFIAPSAEIIGRVSIAEDCSIWPMAVLRGDIHDIQIGARSNIQDGTICHVTHDSEYDPGGTPLMVGEDVTVGHRVILHACTIQDLCLIGMGSIILDKAMIESQVMIGAGSLVPQGKILESGFLWLGSPIRKIRKLTGQELEFLKYSAAKYVELKNSYHK